MRNPKDMLVSMYNFQRNLAWFPFDGSFEQLVDLFHCGKRMLHIFFIKKI